MSNQLPPLAPLPPGAVKPAVPVTSTYAPKRNAAGLTISISIPDSASAADSPIAPAPDSSPPASAPPAAPAPSPVSTDFPAVAFPAAK